MSGQSSVTWQGPPLTGTPNAFPDQNSPITLTGQIDSTTGAILGASLSLPPLPQPEQQGENTTFTFSEVSPGTATGTYNQTTGAVTLNDSLKLTFVGTGLASITCVSQPINVALSGTYDSTTEDVTLATTSSFTIPQFAASSGNNCGLAYASLNASPGGVAGSVGNAMTLALNGNFSPLLPSATTLQVSPASPQPAGTSVTLTATVTDPSGAGTPTGTVSFEDNGASIGSGTLASGSAMLTTSTLPGGTNQLSASYVGDTSYGGSVSAAQAYDIQAMPTISATLPSSTTPGTTEPFTLTVSDPASGQSYANMYVDLGFADGSPLWWNGPYIDPAVSYQDAGGNWCPFNDPSQNWGDAYYTGMGAPPCGTAPNSFALSPGTTLTIPMEISFPTGTDDVGTARIAAYLYTGTCSSSTTCTKVAPFNTSSKAPSFTSYVNVVPPGGAGTASAKVAAKGLSTTVRQGFVEQLQAQVTAASGVWAVPTGTLQFFIDGQSAGAVPLTPTSYGDCSNSGDCYSRTSAFYASTAGLAPGTHTLLLDYSGDETFAVASATATFTVVAGPPPGTAFTCDMTNGLNSPLPFAAYVSAAGTAPAAATSGSTVPVSNVTVSLDVDRAGASYANGSSELNNLQAAATIEFSADAESATSGPITFAASATDVAGTWTGISTSFPLMGTPGTAVQLGVSSISFGVAFGSVDCTPVDQAATLATVTVSGNTLAASPDRSANAGAPVTLTDTVYPAPSSLSGDSYSGGQVDFYDGTTDLGTVPVATSGTAVGTATFTTASLATGDHELTAIWSGNNQIGPNTSNTVDYQVGTTTTTTVLSSANPANAANPVTFTATVSPPPGASTQPTGDVSFTSDGNPISGCGNQPLSMASPPAATCTTSFGAGQSHAIVATYGGDGTYLGSASDPLTQKTLAGTNTSILSTKDPSPPGNVTFWSGVSPSSGTGATPTGTVAFSIDGSVYKPCNAQPLGSGGGASCTVSFKAGTSHKVFATYAGSATYSGSKSNTLTQTVTGAKGSTDPKTTGGSATLASGKSLTVGQSLTAGSDKLVMQADGNLVEYQGSKALWASGTSGHPGAGVTMQKDGNLVIYSQGKAIWASKTAGHPGAQLTLQASDGNVVIYTPANNAVWATGT